MQKKLIALAVAGVFAAPAFAATSNVDVYGAINVSIDTLDNGEDTNTRMVTNNNSFLGFKGSEDLGGGMKAIWQLETNVNFDSTESNSKDAGNMWGTRNTFIGLSSGFGTVVVGTHDTPYKMATGSLDQFVGTIGDYNGLMGSAGWAGSNPSSTFDLRTGNTIAYLSPNFSGFDIKAAYVLGGETENSSSSTGADAWSVSGTYKNGPIFVTAAYESHNDFSTASCNPGAVCLGQTTSSKAYDRDAWKIGASYKFGNLTVGAMYESQDSDKFSSQDTNGSGKAGGTKLTDMSHDKWGVNAAYEMGAFTFKGEYFSADDVGSVHSSGAELWALGVDYAFSKRTKLQLTYAEVNNDSLGKWAMGQGAQLAGAATGDDVNGWSLGIRHTF